MRKAKVVPAKKRVCWTVRRSFRLRWSKKTYQLVKRGLKSIVLNQIAAALTAGRSLQRAFNIKKFKLGPNSKFQMIRGVEQDVIEEAVKSLIGQEITGFDKNSITSQVVKSATQSHVVLISKSGELFDITVWSKDA